MDYFDIPLSTAYIRTRLDCPRDGDGTVKGEHPCEICWQPVEARTVASRLFAKGGTDTNGHLRYLISHKTHHVFVGYEPGELYDVPA